MPYQEFPKWNRIAALSKENNYVPVGISTGSIDSIKEHLKENETNFEILIMPSMAVQRAYRVVAIPQVMIISSQGTVVWVHNGALTENNIAEVLSELQKTSSREVKRDSARGYNDK